MKFGFMSYTTDYTISPVELGRALVERGLESLFVPEHTHIPAKRETPWMGLTHKDEADKGDPMYLPDWYENCLDPFVALTATGIANPGLVVGTGVSLINQYSAISFAKSVMSIDTVLGPDRFICGVGAGWNIEEMRNHGVNPDRRWTEMEERIAAAKAIWAEDEAEFHGEATDFDPIRSFPKPATKPAPPVLIGGRGQKQIDRVVKFADGWMPIVNRGSAPTIDDVADGVKYLRQRGEELGRRFTTTVCDMRVDPKVIAQYREMGVDRYVFGCNPLPRDEVLALVDQCAFAIEKS